jgi:hypothetical protein
MPPMIMIRRLSSDIFEDLIVIVVVVAFDGRKLTSVAVNLLKLSLKFVINLLAVGEYI